MKITKADIESIKPGESKQFCCTPQEMLSARAYVYQRNMVIGSNYTTSYNRNEQKLTITHPM
jgi:hypothetical protein